jgi:hypothetical protein
MKKNIFEQQSSSADLKAMRDEYKCSFLSGGEIFPNTTIPGTTVTNNTVIVKDAQNSSPNGTYNAGDKLIITNEQVGEVWVYYVVPKDDWDKSRRKEGNKFVITLKDEYNEGLWKCSNYTKVTSGISQEKTAQQEKVINDYVQGGWKDLGGLIAPHEINKYITINLKDFYPKEFPNDYILVKDIIAIDEEDVIIELNELIQSRKYGDRKVCSQIIERYNILSEKNTRIDDVKLKNYKDAVKYCESKIQGGWKDLGITKKRIEQLKTKDNRYNLTKVP